MYYEFPQAELERIAQRKWILDFVPKKSIGAELGVFRGHFSEVIAQIVQPQKLFLVDFWTKQGDFFGDYGDYTNHGLLPTEFAKNEVIERMRQYGTKSRQIQIVEDDCVHFLHELQETLDFVYLDTYHTFEETVLQLRTIDQILKADGLILGDDWWPDRSSEHHGVFLAVHDFIRNTHYEMVACGPGGQFCLRKAPTADSICSN